MNGFARIYSLSTVDVLQLIENIEVYTSGHIPFIKQIEANQKMSPHHSGEKRDSEAQMQTDTGTKAETKNQRKKQKCEQGIQTGTYQMDTDNQT